MSIRNVAFYLPQFYPFAENNAWWGKGFTEWTNVTKAKPLFDGHYQPHLPTDLGFYDLRVRETRYEQIELAKAYGIDAFCYHYYWFSGKRLLDLPVDDMLADPKADMPFMLCWANENWTRRWDGEDQNILIAQKYRDTDNIDFIKSVVPFFNDKRYLRVNGAPAFIVYHPQHLPETGKTLNIWREYCKSVGIPKLHLICAMVFGQEDDAHDGFDAGVQFPPHTPGCSNLARKIDFHEDHTGPALDYSELAQSYLAREYAGKKVYRTVVPSWDNTARVGNRAKFLLNGTPANYEFWLKRATQYTQDKYPDDSLVFINAWNEWAEGCHLEPDRQYGRQFLEATLRVANGTSKAIEFADVGIPDSARFKLGLRTIVRGKRSFKKVAYGQFRQTVDPILVRFPQLGALKRKLAGLFR